MHVGLSRNRNKTFTRASREISVPRIVERRLLTRPDLNYCTQAMPAGAVVKVRSQNSLAASRERYTEFAILLMDPRADVVLT